jgi:hypothetical protein
MVKAGYLLIAALLVSCVSAPSADSAPSTGNWQAPPPQWVTDKNAAYPDSEWLCGVSEAPGKEAAETAAKTALAQVFRVDLNAVTNANQYLAQMMSEVGGKQSAMFQQSMEIAQELVSTSSVSGLIGVQVESWIAPDGMFYANARMNRWECSARYSAMIRENEQVIGQLKDGAAGSPYLLSADFSLEDVAVDNPQQKFVRYVLNCSLKNKAGVEILSHSENNREGHRTLPEARQRVIRVAENSICGTGTESFAAKFDSYLASLL